MTDSGDAGPDQAQPDVERLQYLDTAFGVTALVPLKEDLLLGGEVDFGSLPLSHDFVAQHQIVTQSDPAGVVCGGATKFMALAFASQEMAREFLKDNPVLSGTLATRLEKAVIVWLKPLNDLPPDGIAEDVKIVTSGVVPVYAGASLMECSVWQPGRPLEVDLDTLVITGSLKGLFAEWSLRQQFGPPMVQVGQRNKLNEIYWAMHISKATGIKFDLATGAFVARDPQSQSEQGVESALVSQTIAAVLQQSGVPAKERTPLRIRAVIDAMKLLCVRSRVTESAAYLKFVESCVERRAGAILAKNDVAIACRNFFKRHGLRPYSDIAENKLRHALQQVIAKHFGIGESHDRGRAFRGLVLRGGDTHDARTVNPISGKDLNTGESKNPATGPS